MTVEKFVRMCLLYKDIMLGEEEVTPEMLHEFDALFNEASISDRLEFAEFARKTNEIRKNRVLAAAR